MPEFKAPPKPLSFDFGLPFEEALAQAKARGVVLPEEYYDAVMDSARRSAFTVSNLAGLGQIQAVHQSLLKALLDGITLDAWKREAAQTIPLPLARLETIYRTNVQTSYMAGHWRAFAEHQDAQPYLMYSAINDSRTRPAHRAMSGYIAPVNDPIWSRWSPPCGYNSLLPWQRVSGNIFIGLKAWYSGPVCEIAGQSGARLSVTAQHPILTGRGWVSAQDVKKGDQLVAYSAPIGRGAVSANLHEDHTPPTIEEVFDALALRASRSMPRSSLHLYGDAKFLQGDVQIVGADRELVDGAITAHLERIDQIFLAHANQCSAFAIRARALLIIARRALSGVAGKANYGHLGWRHSISRYFNTPLFEVGGQSLPINVESSLQVSRRSPIAIQIAHNIRNWLSEPSGSSSQQLPRDNRRGLRFGPLGDTRFSDVFIGGLDVNANALRDVLQAHARSVQLEDVVNVTLRDWSGHVYDLETASGNILAYGNTGHRHYVVSNCRCGLVALTEEQAKRRGLGKQDRPAVEPDPGFGGHPLDQEQELMALLTEQAKEAPVPVQAALAKRLTDAAKG